VGKLAMKEPAAAVRSNVQTAKANMQPLHENALNGSWKNRCSR